MHPSTSPVMHPSDIAWNVEVLMFLPAVRYEVRRCLVDDYLCQFPKHYRVACRIFLMYEEKRLARRLGEAVNNGWLQRRDKTKFRLMRVRLLKTLVNDSLDLDEQMAAILKRSHE